ncbi:dolichyl-diphosphooligosaccharide--protein glycosyltransferase subunit STT3B isoform X4 [Hyposmocoma kahamanoa]|uniref:dolichyl-diphosphooligosaccharide--protein glycosyltransferase subunit STT3B isoform X4 n=1 Tax=Hyposmocoma kahamanoa TaxID=1477025 RepID=UPI000E6D68CB|nr:dolichyl-diphosphooligosaccharide--protein glycosyltransferase subunit STT3B isoform X4 [Hyposmocoma kahamanoa]
MPAAAVGKPGSSPTKTMFNNMTGFSTLITVTVLSLAWLAGFASRLFAVIRFESIIHEFDPWFNYRSTAYMVEHGFYNFLNWFDERAWYPLGRIVGGTVYPGLMITSGTIHWVLHALNIPIHIRDICVFLAPVFSGLTAIATYLLTSELWSRGAGLFAACFIAIIPGYVFIINLIPLHVFVLLIMGRFSQRLFVSYTIFYIIGLLCSMQIPFVGFQPIRTSEHMAASGVFALLMAVGALKYIHSLNPKGQWKKLLIVGGLIAAGVVFLVVVLLTYLGVIAPWSGRFYSLWDTGYAKIHIPIIASVSEHQPTTWSSFFFDLHVLVCTFPVGLWYCIKNINDERVFVALYALSAVYFAGVMVRLMLTLTPVVCVLAGIAFSILLDLVLREDDATVPLVESEESKNLFDKAGKVKKRSHSPPPAPTDSGLGMNVRSGTLIAFMILLMLFSVHCTWATSNAYSSPSIVLASYGSDGSRRILDDFREAYGWLSQNTAEDARVMSWWDYGYQIAGMGNRTTLVDNNTWNNSHIALVGKAMASNESAAYDIMTALDVDYVLVIFGGAIGYSGDDINKFIWMVRIAEGEHPKDIHEADYFTERGEYRIDAEGSKIMLNCLMYKLSYYRYDSGGSPSGYDRTRGALPGNRGFSLTYLEEAYTTEHWLVRIYRVKKPEEFNRPRIPLAKRTVPSSKSLSKKSELGGGSTTLKRRKGLLKNKPTIVKGKKVTRLE